MYKIERLKLFQIEELAKFMANSNFLWDDIRLLKYIIEKLSRRVDDNIVVTHNGRIVGCNLFLHTFASINGKSRAIRWSHSTYLEREHRKYIGLEFFLNSYSDKDTWGFGLTEINRKIHVLNGSTFCGESRAYIVSPFYSSAFKKMNCGSNVRDFYSEYILPSNIELDGRSFIRCHSKDDHKMPHDGFWNPQILNVDFMRNQEFMKKRFYNCPNHYHVYKCILNTTQDELYFVFKIQFIKGMASIFLVDYRFDLSNAKGLSIILDCLCYIAFINSIGRIFLFTTLPSEYVVANYATIIPYGSDSVIVTNSLGISADAFIMATPADSDCELIPN